MNERSLINYFIILMQLTTLITREPIHLRTVDSFQSYDFFLCNRFMIELKEDQIKEFTKKVSGLAEAAGCKVSI